MPNNEVRYNFDSQLLNVYIDMDNNTTKTREHTETQKHWKKYAEQNVLLYQ